MFKVALKWVSSLDIYALEFTLYLVEHLRNSLSSLYDANCSPMVCKVWLCLVWRKASFLSCLVLLPPCVRHLSFISPAQLFCENNRIISFCFVFTSQQCWGVLLLSWVLPPYSWSGQRELFHLYLQIGIILDYSKWNYYFLRLIMVSLYCITFISLTGLLYEHMICDCLSDRCFLCYSSSQTWSMSTWPQCAK